MRSLSKIIAQRCLTHQLSRAKLNGIYRTVILIFAAPTICSTYRAKKIAQLMLFSLLNILHPKSRKNFSEQETFALNMYTAYFTNLNPYGTF